MCLKNYKYKMGKNNQRNSFKHKNHGGKTNFRHNNKPYNNKNNQFNKSPKKHDNAKPKTYESLKETDLGITEYISESIGFNGVIKQRFSDFHVNEIDLNGTVIKLTDLKAPVTPKDESENLTIDEAKKRLITSKFLTEDQMNSIKKLSNSKENLDPIEIDVTELTKEQRTDFHNSLKLIYGGMIITNTVENDGKKFIKCTKFSKNVRVDKRQKWPWEGEYTYFVVHKENVDTMKAAMMISQCLNCRPSAITYAGTKDKRAKTSQLFCMKRRYPDAILKAVKLLPNVFVGNFQFKTEPLKLGQLKGNRFRIALRNVTADNIIIQDSINSIKMTGFINYYGLQRFGNCVTVPTHKIGESLLQGKWKEAVELILKPRENDPEFMKEMRDYWWKSRDAQGALNKLKWEKTVEAKLLVGLVNYGHNDFVGALGNLPRNMRLLYVHAYQSLIWNRVVSRRIKEWGLELHKGDLVFVDKEKDYNLEIEDTTEISDENVPETSEDVTEEKEEISKFKSLAKPLTKEDIESGNYNIHDLVLPLPGHDILYPNNKSADWYDEYLGESDLSSEKLKQKVKLYSLTGAYRKVFVKPESMKWSIKTYKSQNETLIISDLEEINKSHNKTTHIHLNENDDKGKDDANAIDKENLKALILEFNLPSSSYATMALREILKIDTSTSNQIKLNNENLKEKSDEKITDEIKPVQKRKIDEKIDNKTNDEKCDDKIIVDNHDDKDGKTDGDDDDEDSAKKRKTE